MHVLPRADWAALTSEALSLLTRVDDLALWTNSHLLFWLSVLPVATAWMGQNLLTLLPTVVYGVVLLMQGIAYYLLVRAIRR
jgi:uncharacterized membrane protein